MIRLAGILAGSAVAAAFLIAVLGMPEFSPAEAEAGLIPPAVVGTEVASVAVDDFPPETTVEVNASNEPASSSPALPLEPNPEIVAEPENIVEQPTMPVEMRSTKLPEPQTGAERFDMPAEVMGTEPTAAGQNWYAFWSPFRSQVAADGFVAELQRTTGLDYRVVKLKPGIYEVAFAYTDDADVETKLAQISTATGLDLSGG